MKLIHTFTLIRNLTIVITFLIPACLAAQTYSSSEGIRQVELLSGQSHSNKEILDFLTEHPEVEFVDANNYYDFLQKIDTFFNDSKPYYAELIFFIGRRLYLSNQYKEAFPYLYKTQLLMSSGQPYDFECDFYEIMGISYFFFKRYEQSKLFFNKALQCDNTTDLSRINILNTLGLIHSNSKPEKSEKYYRKAMQIAQKTGNTAWYGVLSGNLGVIYYNRKQHDLAKQYLEFDFQISEKLGEIESAVSAMSKLLEIDIIHDEYVAARKKYRLIDSIALKNKKILRHLSYYESKALWYE